MKNRSLRELMPFCLIALLLLGAMFFLASRTEDGLPANSVLNRSAQGFSVYFEVLQALGADARRITGPVHEQPGTVVQIVAYPWWFDATTPEIAQWVEDGGTLVLVSPGFPPAMEEGELLSQDENLSVYRQGKGRILTLDAADLKNKTLVENTIPSWNLTRELMATGGRTILFNELELFPESASPSLWAAVPLWLKLLLYQLLLVAGAWFWMRGSRLGKPLQLTAETERTELEYLKAAAHFYRAAGCLDLMLEAYFRSLLRLLDAQDDDWTEVWKREGLPDLHQAEALQRWMAHISPVCTAREIQHQIMLIEHLKDTIKNRRIHPWKNLR